MFRTKINITPVKDKINLKDKVFSIGSCFAVNTGEKLKSFKFSVLVNPFGVVFNPVSVFRSIAMSLNNEPLNIDSIIQNQGIYQHFDLHSDVSADRKENLIRNFEERKKRAGQHLLESRVILITLGTAVVYVWKKTGRIVANCHKIPAGEFEKRLLDVDEIVSGFNDLYGMIKKYNPDVRFVLSVSPVRHIRDGFVTNSVSKSILRLSAEKIASKFDHTSYFPSFEIMMDDLRDYRFYNRDMLHPSPEGIDYIWKQFKLAYFDDQTNRFCDGWAKVIRDVEHKPYYPESEAYKDFLGNALARLKQFEDLVDIEPEYRMLHDRMNE